MVTSTPLLSMPGLSPIPWMGRHLALPRLYRDPLRLLPRLYRDHGCIAALNRGDTPVVCAFGPEYNQQLLQRSAEFEHFAEVPMRIPPGSALERMQANLLTSNGQTHRRKRRMMMPSFAKGAIQHYRDDMVSIIERRLEPWSVGQAVDAAHTMEEIALDVILKCQSGLDVDDDALQLGGMGKEYLARIISPSTALMPVDLPVTSYGRLLRLCTRMEERMMEMIKKRRVHAEKGRDVLSRLLEAHDDEGVGFSDAELLGNMALMFVAGYETTANAMIWTLMMLAQHPRWWSELREELEGRLHGEAPRAEQLSELPLLDAIIKESMRLMPPTYMTFIRRAVGSFQLGPYTLPAGTLLVLSPLVTHQMEEIYSDPFRFDPSRWESFKPSPFEYLPFGAGPRRCIGASFAQQEIRLVLSIIVQRYDLRFADGTQIDAVAGGITMGPRNGMPMRIYAAGEGSMKPSEVGGSVREMVRW